MFVARFSSATIAAMFLYAGVAFASSHGNDLVHARKIQGVVYTMNQFHMALYTYDGDDGGLSDCYGDCAANWPPALLDAGAELGENYTLVARRDGSMQIAFKGQPLYLYSGDTAIGDINGDGVGGVWRLSQP